MSAVGRAIEAKRRQAADVLDLLSARGDAIVGLGNGEPKTVIDAIEAGAERFEELRLHQMLPLRDRPYIEGQVPGLRHVSWFLSPHDKGAFHRGECDLVPNNFSEVPALMRRTLSEPVALAAASPPDAHGYFSLGTHAEYVAPMIGEIPFFLEVNAQMPRTFGENQIHVSQTAGWCEADYPLVELPPRPARDADRRIAALVAERIPDGATIQAGIGAVTGTRKRTHRNKLITTSAVGTRRLYEFVADNPGVEFWPVDETNDPKNVSAEPRFTAINATIEVDFLG